MLVKLEGKLLPFCLVELGVLTINLEIRDLESLVAIWNKILIRINSYVYSEFTVVLDSIVTVDRNAV